MTIIPALLTTCLAAPGVLPESPQPGLLGGSLGGSQDIGAAAQEERLGKVSTKVTMPTLFVEGEPFFVELKVVGDAAKIAEFPSWMLSPAAWLMDAKPLQRRASDAMVRLQPGQSLSSTVDLAPMLTDRFGEDPGDFRLSFSEGPEVTDVIYLGLPERGINFEELPTEQLGNYQVVLQTTSGPIWVELWPDVAPNHVRNFLDLCATGFYDGSPFHRVIPSFMVQGGRAKDGSPAPRKVNAEFNQRPHDAGVLSAARFGADINSASSEFFFVHRASRHLDGQYSGFGKIITGMDSVDQIVGGVEIHYQLLKALALKRLIGNPNNPSFGPVRDAPNPAQEIRQALVVKATRSRPATTPPEDKR